MVSLIDVTDTVNYDLSKEQNELLSLINATVSHELRNPLNAIVSQNEVLRNVQENMQSLAKKLDGLEASREL